MCGVCGCGDGEVRIGTSKGPAGPANNRPSHGHVHAHPHVQNHSHNHAHTHHLIPEPDPIPADDLEKPHHQADDRTAWFHVEQGILSKNDAFAAANRQRFEALGVLALNLVSSPGAGKTSLLAATASALSEKFAMAVIEGDQETENDAERIRATGVSAVQINTGRVCHLDAHMIGHAFDELPLGTGAFEGARAGKGGVLFVENVGNLVCPAAFDLGERHKVAVLSVTEGEDKPIKYPDMFAASRLMIINKIDLLPYVDFDVARCVEYARRVNPAIQVLQVCATKGEGMDRWFGWIEKELGLLKGSQSSKDMAQQNA